MGINKNYFKALLLSFAAALSFSCKKSANAAPEYFIGANLWYGALLQEDRMCAELDSLKSLGITNLRILVGAEGPDGIDRKIEPSLQPEPGIYNENVLNGLERLLSELEKRQMKAVLYLNNSWDWSGGYGTYLEWAGEAPAPKTHIEGYPAYNEHVSRYITNEKAKEFYFNHVRFIVNRFRNSKAIYSWQIGNEPRCFSADASVQDAFVDYIYKAAALIKSIDPEHPVSTGSEGIWGCEGSIDLYERINACPDVDYITIHIWPFNWGWAREEYLYEDIDNSIAKTDEYISRSIEVADKLGKKIIIEEFGYPRDGFTFSKETPVTARDRYYEHIFKRIEESAKQGGTILGCNFWAWGGLASQNPNDIWWKAGDDYCGDPAQEQQGLYSVYASDSSTVELIRRYTGIVNKL